MYFNVERAAFELWVYQAESWDLPRAAAEMQWESDSELRNFWHNQVSIVMKHIF